MHRNNLAKYPLAEKKGELLQQEKKENFNASGSFSSLFCPSNQSQLYFMSTTADNNNAFIVDVLFNYFNTSHFTHHFLLL